MILSCNDISKAFGTDEIINHASFHIEEREKAAIIGINGAGKSTLLKIIMGELSADSGSVVLARDKTIGYLAQHQNVNTDNTIYEEILSTKQNIIDMENRIRSLEASMKQAEGAELEKMLNSYSSLNHQFELLNGYSYRSEVTGILKGLAFTEEDFNRPINTLSGGQKTRVALAKLLVSKPDIILLDEPTNHLDLESIAWLETFLLNYGGSVLIVAHDRYFLDKIVTKIIEIDNTKVSVFSGNYSAYSEKKAMIRQAKLNEYLKQQNEIKHQEEVITKLKQFNREKSIKRAESREKMLEKMELVEKPTELNTDMRMKLEPKILSGNDVLSVKSLTKSFPDKPLFEGIDFEIKRGEKVALIGNNGTGKTTLLKIINGFLSADSGSITLGSNVTIGYYDQEHAVLNMDKTLFEEISDAYPDLTNTEIRNVLAAYLFTNDDVFKKISSLSGGERGRVSLAKLMLSNANFLILDEPTNHLDITSKEILENALNSYTGTVLYVSHDRYFINATATRIIELSANTITNYIGNYDYYLEKKDILSPKEAVTKNTVITDTASKTDWKSAKEEQAALRKKKNELAKTEEQINQSEERIKEIDEMMTQPDICRNTSKLLELHKEKEKLSSDLINLYEKWEELAE